MQAKSRRFQYWGYLLAGALAFAGFYFVKTMGQKMILKSVIGEPAEVIDRAMNSARVSPRITSRIGEVSSRNFQLNQIGNRKDTLVFRVSLKGERADAALKLWMVKRPSGEWNIVKSDTLFLN
ncbi:hypothetical protein [Hymenobacter swuensis]|nr:hypothetical protein [Hymenobacter swuensis]